MWDIPSSTGLAILPDILPMEAPTTFQKDAPLAADIMSHQNSVAVIDISGVITPYSNILSMLFGGTSISAIEQQFEQALGDPEIDGIVLRIDSPGGIITGVEEFASSVFAARGSKPIVAYAYGNAASAAYWIAAAADKIVAGPTTMLGSIGVAMAVPKNRDIGWVEFVSSNAPAKRLDPESNEGRESIQARLDAMEAEFIGAVARFRDVSTDDVLSKFGAGDVLPAREAVRSGMADLVGGLKDALALISPPQPPTKGVVMTKLNTPLAETPENPGNTGDMVALSAITPDYIAKNHPEIASSMTKDSFNEGYKAGSETERARILGLEDVAMSGHEDLLEQARSDGKSKAADLALKIVAAEKQRGGNVLKTMEEETAAEPVVTPSTGQAPHIDVNAPIEERAESEWQASADIRTEFADKDAYIAFRKAEDSGRVKRYAPRSK